MPSCVNNVETFADVPYIINEGAEKFAAMGSENQAGHDCLVYLGILKDLEFMNCRSPFRYVN